MKRRILSLLLAILMVFPLFPLRAMEADAASTGLNLLQLRQKFPHGKYWNHAGNPGASNSVNNQDGYTSTPCSVHKVVGTSKQTCNGFQPSGTQLSWQCMGYAEKLGYDATGYNPRNNANGWYTYTSSSALDKLKPGDIVRYKDNSHSIYVIGVNGETVTYTDCNSDGHCIIRWDATISKATLRSSFTHVRSAPSSVLPGSDTCSCSSSYAGTYVCTTAKANLTIRSGHGSSYGSVGSISPGASVTVSKASGTGKNDWAHVTYNGVSGYASMEYLQKKTAPAPSHAETPTLHYWISDSEYGEQATDYLAGNRYYFCYRLYDSVTGKNWNEVENSSYTVKLTFYNPDGSVKYSNTTSSDQSWISSFFETPGTYKFGLVLDGDYLYSGTGAFEVKANPKKIYASASSANLTLGGTESVTLKVWSGGYYNGSCVFNWQRSNSNVSCKWGDWTDDGYLPITFTAVSRGSSTVTLSIKDKETGAVLDSIKITINVNAKEYVISYNGNGGKNVPSNQIKYHGTDLILSGVKPTRDGYTFLGWSESSAATSATYQPGGKYTSNSGATLYAVWKSGCENNAHSYTYKVNQNPTTSATGSLKGTCSKCGGTTSVTLPKLNTSDYNYKVTTSAGCEASGTACYTWKTTSYGSFSFNVSVSAKGHAYGKTVTAPTCSAQGYTTYTCSACGKSYRDSYTEALGHSYTYKVNQNPTTSATGSLKGTCSKCGGITSVTLPKLNTTDYSYKVTTASTCKANGKGCYTWKTTSYGSFSFDVSLPKADHSYGKTQTPATCTAGGYTTYTCNVCGYSYQADATPKLDHKYTYKVSKTPTLTESGSLKGVCSACATFDRVELPVLNKTDYRYEVVKESAGAVAGIGRYVWKNSSYGNFSFEVSIEPVFYTVVFFLNGGVQPLPARLEAFQGEKVKIPSVEPGRSGYEFLGWATSSSATTPKYCSGDWIIVTCNMNLYAVWSKKPSYQSVSVETLPRKVTYQVGEALDLDGLALQLHDGFGNGIIVVSGFTVVEGDTSRAGTVKITVAYQGLTASFEITVKEKESSLKGEAELNSVSGRVGEEVKVLLSVVSAPEMKSLGISDIVFDETKLELLGGKWLGGQYALEDFSVEDRVGAVTFAKENGAFGGVILELTFRVKEDAAVGDALVSLKLIGKQKQENQEVSVNFNVADGKVAITSVILGDLDGSDSVTSDDAVYLLYYTLLGEGRYPVNQNVDYNKDGGETSDDAVYLLYYTLLGEGRYPL